MVDSWHSSIKCPVLLGDMRGWVKSKGKKIMTQKNILFIASKTQGITKVGEKRLIYTDHARPELGIFLKADGRELYAADYPELAKHLGRTLGQRLRGVFKLPDWN